MAQRQKYQRTAPPAPAATTTPTTTPAPATKPKPKVTGAVIKRVLLVLWDEWKKVGLPALRRVFATFQTWWVRKGWPATRRFLLAAWRILRIVGGKLWGGLIIAFTGLWKLANTNTYTRWLSVCTLYWIGIGILAKWFPTLDLALQWYLQKFFQDPDRYFLIGVAGAVMFFPVYRSLFNKDSWWLGVIIAFGIIKLFPQLCVLYAYKAGPAILFAIYFIMTNLMKLKKKD